MIGKVQVTTKPPLFDIGGESPERIRVAEAYASGWAGYAVRSVFGGGEHVLCFTPSSDDANAIAEVVAEYCLIPVEKAGDTQEGV